MKEAWGVSVNGVIQNSGVRCWLWLPHSVHILQPIELHARVGYFDM